MVLKKIGQRVLRILSLAVIAGLFIGSLVFAALLAVYFITYGPDKITVFNQTSAPLTEVHLIGSGFTERIGRIEPGQSAVVSVRPAGDSDLEIRFKSPEKQISREGLAYLCGCRFHIKLTVLTDYQVKSEVL